MPIFISYRHVSGGEFAQRIATELAAKEIPVWYAPDAISDGTTITGNVNKALSGASAAIIVFTPDYLSSSACFLELAQIICRLCAERGQFAVFVVNPAADSLHIKPAVLNDLRQTAPWNVDNIIQAIASHPSSDRRASTVEPANSPLKTAHFGYVPIVASLVVPIGHETSFWDLHDMLSIDEYAQTRVAIRNRVVTVGGIPGAGSAELVLTYADLVGSCFPGGVFWFAGAGQNEQLAALRGIGESLGLSPQDLDVQAIEANLKLALRRRDRYLWVVIGEHGSARSQHSFQDNAPTLNGTSILVHEDLDRGSDLNVGPVDREAANRILTKLVGASAAQAIGDNVFDKTGGHLYSVLYAVKLIKLVGFDLAWKQLADMSLDEIGLRSFSVAYQRLGDSQRALLHLLCLLPKAAAIPNVVVEAMCHQAPPLLFPAVRIEDFAALRAVGAVSQTPDQQSSFVVAVWRLAADASYAQDRLTAKPADLREAVVRSLASALPKDTRTQQTPLLAQLELLARYILDTIRSEIDCQLAIRCAAINALYGDHDKEREIIERAFSWANATLGATHEMTLELVCELASCPAVPRRITREKLELAFTIAKHGVVPPALYLRIMQEYAIEIGDESPKEALELLQSEYALFEGSSDIEPSQHLMFRNSIGTFRSAYDREEAVDIYTKALEFAKEHGLDDTQGVLRIKSNLAMAITEHEPTRALEITRAAFEYQKRQFGSGHHLTVWAAVDYLQNTLLTGQWQEALTLIEIEFAPYRTILRSLHDVPTGAWGIAALEHINAELEADELTSSASAVDAKLPMRLNSLTAQQLVRLSQLVRVAAEQYIRPTGLIPPPRSKHECIPRMLVFIELFDFAPQSEPYLALILNDFLFSPCRLQQIDWSPIRVRLPGYYSRLHQALPPTRKSRRTLRRIARILVADQGFFSRFHLKRLMAQLGLPTSRL